MAVWILAAASGWRPIASSPPLPVSPRPMPEPMAARPIASGSAYASAVGKFGKPIDVLLVSVLQVGGALRTVCGVRIARVVLVVRQHHHDVDGAEQREHEAL